MAGAWIKMRCDIGSDPKVIAMARSLATERSFMDWLTDGFMQRCEKSALEHVPLGCVTRCVTAALLRFWGVANEAGETQGDDLLLRYADRYTVDDVADLPGLGAAMESVGWLISQPDEECVILPRFRTHNVPEDQRPQTKNAQRQQRFRKRHGSVTSGVTASVTERVTERVTGNVTVTHRTEQNRTEQEPAAVKEREERISESRTPVSAAAVPAAVPDRNLADNPETRALAALFSDVRGKAAHQAAKREPVPVSKVVGTLAGVKGKRRTPRRIPEGDQHQTRMLLAGIAGIDQGDAADLATIGTFAEFRAAVTIMPADVKNPGGWLRRAVEEGWKRNGQRPPTDNR